MKKLVYYNLTSLILMIIIFIVGIRQPYGGFNILLIHLIVSVIVYQILFVFNSKKKRNKLLLNIFSKYLLAILLASLIGITVASYQIMISPYTYGLGSLMNFILVMYILALFIDCIILLYINDIRKQNK